MQNSDNPQKKLTTGILLTNLGTPDAPTPQAVRRFLAEFLGDPHVVDFNRVLWWLILHGLILPFRPYVTAKAYQKIWTTDGSPLLTIVKNQTQGLQTCLQTRFDTPIKVVAGMRYGKPSLADGLTELRHAGVQNLIVLPLYPQYANATSGTSLSAINRLLQKQHWSPTVRCIRHYAENTNYIDALAQSVREHWENHKPGDQLLFSFHGLPKKSLENGDPYYNLCLKTANLVAQKLQLQCDLLQKKACSPIQNYTRLSKPPFFQSSLPS